MWEAASAVKPTMAFIGNGSISQRFLPHKQLTISLRAIDILNERDDINRSVSAVSRTDTQSEMVRSYVLLSAYWRFGRFGGKGMGGGKGKNKNKGDDGPHGERDFGGGRF